MAAERKKTILIIEDNRWTREAMRDTLSRDYNVLLAQDGQVGLETLLRERRRVSCVLLDIQMPVMDGWEFLRRIRENDVLKWIPIIIISASADDITEQRSLSAGAWGFVGKGQSYSVLNAYIENAIFHRNNYMALEEHRLADIDAKTGIWNKEQFYRQIRHTLDANPDEQYSLIRFDLDRFKVYNDIFGAEAGDRLLRYVGNILKAYHPEGSLYAHVEADHFALLLRRGSASPESLYSRFTVTVSKYPVNFDFSIKAGIYEIEDVSIDPSIMCDRALLALRTTKSSATKVIGYYDSELRNRLILEQELITELKTAFEKQEFEVYYQPQFNYSTGEMIGAEALVRWNHPTLGLVAPGVFIPVMEKNGLISKLDEYVWEQCCQQLSKWRETGRDFSEMSLSLSANVSRIDIYRKDLCELICSLTDRYDIPHSILKFEITESAYMEDPAQLLSTVSELRSKGFIVEMDDFGSGYSSLNTLKDVPVDILKLDMKFLSESQNSTRGGSILSSVVRMARWLKLPVIAEGIETKEQADYLKSIGCLYMQGFFFAKPMPAASFEELLNMSTLGTTDKYLEVDTSKAEQFWDASAQSALIFNSFVGGAAIVEYDGSEVEMVRLNDRFLEIVDATREEYLPLMRGTQERFVGEYRRAFLELLSSAAATNEEASCELCSRPIRGSHYIWTLCRARLLCHNVGSDMFYLSFEDVTNQHIMRNELQKQKAFLQSLYETIPGGVLLFDVGSNGLTLRSCNEQAWKILGYDSYASFASDILSSSPPSTVFAADYERSAEINTKLLSGELTRADSTFRVSKPDGSYRWIRSISERSRFRDGTDVIERVLIDVTEQKSAQLSVYSSALLGVFDNVSLLDFAEDTSTLLFSKMSGRSVGVTSVGLAQNIEERLISSIIPEDRKHVRESLSLEYIKQHEHDGEAPSFEFKAAEPSSDYHWFRCSLVQMESDCYLACVKDITDSRHTSELEAENALLKLQLDYKNVLGEHGSILLQHFGVVSGIYSPKKDVMEYTCLDEDGNPTLCRLENYLRDEKHCCVSDRDAPKFLAAISAASASPMSDTLDFLGSFSSIGEQLYRLRYSSVADADGEISQVICLVENVQDSYDYDALSIDLCDQFGISRASDKENSFVSQMLDILNNSTDPGTAIDTLLRIAGENLDVSRVYVLNRIDDAGTLAMPYEWTAPGAPEHDMSLMPDISSKQFAECISPILAVDRQMRCSDVTTLAPFARQVYEKNNVKAVIICAITLNGRQSGFLCFDECRSPRVWMEVRRQLLNLLSRIVGALFLKAGETPTLPAEAAYCQKKVLSAATSEVISDAPFEAMLKAAGIVLLEWRRDSGELRYTEGYLGYELSRHNFLMLYNKTGSELAHPDDYPALKSLYSAFSRGENVVSLSLRLRMTDGSLRMTKLALSFETDGGAEPVRALVHMVDVQEEYQRLLELSRHNEELSSLIDHIPVGLAVYDADNGYAPMYYSENALNMFGIVSDNCGESSESGFQISPMLDARSEAEYLSSKRSGDDTFSTLRATRRDGSRFWLRVGSRRICRDGQNLIFCTFSDVTEQVEKERNAQWQLERYRIISDAVNIMTYDYDPESDIMSYTVSSKEGGLEKFEKLHYVQNFWDSNRVHPDDRKAYIDGLTSASKTMMTGTLEFQIDYLDNGCFKWYRTNYTSVASENGQVFRVVGKTEDIDDEKRQRDNLLQRAEYDGTTGLMNKDTARIELEKLLLKKPQDRLDAMMMIDLDDFKQINDTCGHAAGDRLLHEFSEKLKALIPEGNIIARFGGDEFVIYFPAVGSEQAVLNYAQKILDAAQSMSEDFSLDTGCSIGIVFIQRRRQNLDAVLKHVDQVLYASKKHGKHRYTVFDPSAPDENGSLFS